MESGPPARANALHDRVAYVYYKHGLFCASHPYAFLLLTFVVASFCCYPLLQEPFLGATFQHLTTSAPHTPPENLSWTPRWFHAPPVGYVQQVVVKSAVSPWQPDLLPADGFRAPLAEIFRMLRLISDHHSLESGSTLSGVCLQVEESVDRSLRDFLPQFGCLVVSPALVWKQDLNRFQRDGNIVRTILEIQKGNSLREILFGIPWKETGIQKSEIKFKPRVLTYAITILFREYDAS